MTTTMTADEKLVKFQLAMALLNMYEEDYEALKNELIIVDMVTNIVDKFEKKLRKDQAIPAIAFFNEMFKDCHERDGISARELSRRMRNVILKSDDPEFKKAAMELRNQDWYLYTCKIYHFSDQRIDQFFKRKEVVKMVAEAARETAENYGFSEYFGKDEGTRNPGVTREFHNVASLTIAAKMLLNTDPLATLFVENIIESFKEYIQEKDLEKNADATAFPKVIEILLEEKDPTVYFRGEKTRLSRLNKDECIVTEDPDGGYTVREKTSEEMMYEKVVDTMEKLKMDVKKMTMKDSDNVTV